MNLSLQTPLNISDTSSTWLATCTGEPRLFNKAYWPLGFGGRYSEKRFRSFHFYFVQSDHRQTPLPRILLLLTTEDNPLPLLILLSLPGCLSSQSPSYVPFASNSIRPSIPGRTVHFFLYNQSILLHSVLYKVLLKSLYSFMPPTWGYRSTELYTLWRQGQGLVFVLYSKQHGVPCKAYSINVNDLKGDTRLVVLLPSIPFHTL